MVPFLPLYRNGDYFLTDKALGYEYAYLLDPGQNGTRFFCDCPLSVRQFVRLVFVSLCRPEVCAGVPDALPPAGPGDLAVAPGIRAPWRRVGLRRGPGDRGGEEEVEAKPEEEEGVQLRGETAAAAEQLRGGLVLVPDHSVATTPAWVQFHKTSKTQATIRCHQMCCSISSFYTSDAGFLFIFFQTLS